MLFKCKLNLLIKVSTQNEILLKRIKDLENIQSHFNKNSNEFKLDEHEIYLDKNNENKETNFDLYEWKNDIEKSLEKISEKVAGSNSSALLNLMEKQLNDFCNELKKLKKHFYEELENKNKYKEKVEKSEKLTSYLNTQLIELKSSTNKWQSDVFVKMNILNERVETEENSSDLFKEFIKVSNVKFENFSSTIQSVVNESKIFKDYFDSKYIERLRQLEEIQKNLVDRLSISENLIKEELFKHEGIFLLIYKKVNNKALWDSMALLTSSMRTDS